MGDRPFHFFGYRERCLCRCFGIISIPTTTQSPPKSYKTECLCLCERTMPLCRRSNRRSFHLVNPTPPYWRNGRPSSRPWSGSSMKPDAVHFSGGQPIDGPLEWERMGWAKERLEIHYRNTIDQWQQTPQKTKRSKSNTGLLSLGSLTWSSSETDCSANQLVLQFKSLFALLGQTIASRMNELWIRLNQVVARLSVR